MSNNFLPTKVEVTLAITPEEVKANIAANLKQIPMWYNNLFYPNGFEAIIISAGPSMEKYVKEINLKERMTHPDRSFVVFCVKHAYPRLMEMGIHPDFCVMLDGRDFNSDSTHGVNRKSLFQKISDKTIFLVASMSHPGYAKYLMEHGARVMGWHTAVKGIEEFPEAMQGVVVNGGTSSGTRCISLAHSFGIRTITLVGFDSCHVGVTPERLNEKDSKGRPKFLPVDLPVAKFNLTPERAKKMAELDSDFKSDGFVLKNTVAKAFITTGELLAQAQDFEGLFKNASMDIDFKVLDDGLVSHMFENIGNKALRSYSFIDYFSKSVPKKNFEGISPKTIQTS